MANRFNTPIASQAISAYAPVNMNVLLNELQMVQKRWDENESFGEQVKKTIEAIPAMPGDVPFRDQLVSSLTSELNKAVSEETDLGSSSFKRKVESIYNKYSTNADIKTLISNSARYSEKEKKKADLEKDGRFTEELYLDNEKTRVDKNGKLIPYNYQLERAFSDEEYLNPIAKFASQLKASSQSGRNFVIDERGNKYTFDFSGKGIDAKQVSDMGNAFANSYINTDVGKQRYKRYLARTGGNHKAAENMFRNDIISYLSGNMFSETSSGKDFDFAPPDIRKRLQEEQKRKSVPDSTFIQTGDYEVEGEKLTLESPEFVKALENLAAVKGVSVDKINKKDFLNSLNDMKTGMQESFLGQPKQGTDIGKLEKRLFGGETKNQIPFVTEDALVRQGTKLVQIGSDRLSELDKGDYKFSIAGIDATNQKLPGAIVITGTHKDGKEEPVTIYMPNTLANTRIAESVDMLGIVNRSAQSPTGTTTPVGGRQFVANGSLFQAPPGTVLNIRTEYTNPTATSKGRARQVAELKVERIDSKGEKRVQVVPVTINELRNYYVGRIWQGLEEDSEE